MYANTEYFASESDIMWRPQMFENLIRSCPSCNCPFGPERAEPHVLPCGHSICSCCVTKTTRDLKGKTRKGRCAVCAESFTVSVCNKLYLDTIVRIMDRRAELEAVSYRCDECEQRGPITCMRKCATCEHGMAGMLGKGVSLLSCLVCLECAVDRHNRHILHRIDGSTMPQKTASPDPRYANSPGHDHTPSQRTTGHLSHEDTITSTVSSDIPPSSTCGFVKQIRGLFSRRQPSGVPFRRGRAMSATVFSPIPCSSVYPRRAAVAGGGARQRLPSQQSRVSTFLPPPPTMDLPSAPAVQPKEQNTSDERRIKIVDASPIRRPRDSLSPPYVIPNSRAAAIKPVSSVGAPSAARTIAREDRTQNYLDQIRVRCTTTVSPQPDDPSPSDDLGPRTSWTPYLAGSAAKATASKTTTTPPPPPVRGDTKASPLEKDLPSWKDDGEYIKLSPMSMKGALTNSTSSAGSDVDEDGLSRTIPVIVNRDPISFPPTSNMPRADWRIRGGPAYLRDVADLERFHPGLVSPSHSSPAPSAPPSAADTSLDSRDRAALGAGNDDAASYSSGYAGEYGENGEKRRSGLPLSPSTTDSSDGEIIRPHAPTPTSSSTLQPPLRRSPRMGMSPLLNRPAVHSYANVKRSSIISISADNLPDLMERERQERLRRDSERASPLSKDASSSDLCASPLTFVPMIRPLTPLLSRANSIASQKSAREESRSVAVELMRAQSPGSIRRKVQQASAYPCTPYEYIEA